VNRNSGVKILACAAMIINFIINPRLRRRNKMTVRLTRKEAKQRALELMPMGYH